MELITSAGYEKLKIKLQSLREQSSEIVERIKAARADSPEISENKEHIDAIEDQSRLDVKIMETEHKISTLRVIDIHNYTDALKQNVRFGSTVTILDCDTDIDYKYKIVGVDEVETLKTDCPHISYKSPVGSAVMGKAVGDEIDVFAPSGERVFEILKIEYI